MPFYRELPELLSQGDIISDVPWGLIEAPTLLCRPNDRTALNGKARYSAVEPWVMQGSPGPWSRDPEYIHAIGWQGLAMVLWHDCQIEKSDNQERDRPDKAFAGVVPIQPLSNMQTSSTEQTDALHAAVREGRHHSYFYLPGVTVGAFAMPDSVANLRYIWSVRQSALQKRAVSLHPEVLMSLYAQLFSFFTRFRLDVDATCPKCGTAVDLTRASDDPGEGKNSN